MSKTSNPGNRFERHRRKIIAVLFVFVVLSGELALRVLASHGLVEYKRYRTDRNPKFWADISPVFGTWHYPSAEFIHQTPCFTVAYESNSYGARDIERSRRSDAKRRIIVLGDSFVEGYGVVADDRMTNILESFTEIEHLNFGTSGSFGSIQEWLLYESLAAEFDHSQVFLFMLPDNDFSDNDPDRWSQNRYRPYLRKVGGEYQVFYPIAFEDRSAGANYSWAKIVKHHVYNNVYLINVPKQAMKRITSGEDRARPDQADRKLRVGHSTYHGFSENNAEILLYTYDRIADLAGDRPLTIFIIPRLGDLVAMDEGDFDPAVVRLLEEYSAGRDDVAVYDLLPYFAEYAEAEKIDPQAFFHACDGHWSPLGNRVAAMAVQDCVHAADPAGD